MRPVDHVSQSAETSSAETRNLPESGQAQATRNRGRCELQKHQSAHRRAAGADPIRHRPVHIVKIEAVLGVDALPNHAGVGIVPLIRIGHAHTNAVLHVRGKRL